MEKMYSTFTKIIAPVIALFFAAAVFAAPAQQVKSGTGPGQSTMKWRPIAVGVEYTGQKIIDSPVANDGVLHIVRIDPSKAKLRSLMSSALDKQRRTARKWCNEFGMIAVINAGMYDIDYLTHVGYMRSGDHVNNAKWSRGYNSILVFDPLRTGLPAAGIIDGVEGNAALLRNFGTVIQNLRLIKGIGRNVWKEKTKKWSESAIAIDRQGRVLFLFFGYPLPLYEFNERLLSLQLEVTHAMHLEGGPDASLSICANELQMHLSGSYETGLAGNESNFGQWGLPNVIGVRADKK